MAIRWSKFDRQRSRKEQFPSSGADLRPSYLLEYYQPAFKWMHWNLPDSLNGVAPSRREFWDLVPPGIYDSSQGRELILQYATSVEKRLASRVRAHSLAYWIHVYRRTSPHSPGQNKTPATIGLVRRTFEAALQKYANIDRVDDLGWSDLVTEDEVLTGVPVQYRGMDAIRAALSGKRKQLLLDFGIAELADLYQCERLAYELWQCGSSLRWLSKGTQLRVDPQTERMFFDIGSDELGKLVAKFDSRDNRSIASATGTVYTVLNNLAGIAPSAIPQYNVTHRPAKEYQDMFDGAPLKFSKEMIFNFEWVPEDFGSFLQSHSFLNTAFRRKHKFSFETVVLVLYVITLSEVTSWASHWEYVLRAFQRAYLILNNMTDFKTLIASSSDAAAKLGAEIPSEFELSLAMDFLTLSEEKRADISLLTGGPKYTFLPVGSDTFVVDYAWIHETMYYLFFGVALQDENVKGELLEKFVTSGRSILPDGECRGFDGESREVDAAFAAGDVLVVAECKAIARSIAFDRGDPQALSFRIARLEEALNQIDDKAQWLSSHPFGRNYDIREFRVIFPVVITPYVEYIPSAEPRYWVDDDLPRVMTPHEFEGLLNNPALPNIAAEHSAATYVVQILKPGE